MLTIEKLKQMSSGEIFASGIGLITHPWFNDAKKVLEEDGYSTKVKWVAVRGKGYHDWCIYHSMDANICKEDYFDSDEHLQASEELIARLGAKLHYVERIKQFVPCDEDSLKLYRH